MKASNCPRLFTLFVISILAFVQAAQNITIDDLDDRITYSRDMAGRWIHQTLTRNSEMYLPMCNAGSLSSTRGAGTATFAFSGTAVYVQSLLNSAGDNMSIILDNTVYGPYSAYSATQNVTTIIFSQENLDPSSLHTLTVMKYNQSSSNYANLDAIIYTSTSTSDNTPSNDTPSNTDPSNTSPSNTVTTTSGTSFSSVTSAAASSASPHGPVPMHRTVMEGMIAGIAGLAVIIIIAILGFFYWRRQRARPNPRPLTLDGKLEWVVDSVDSCDDFSLGFPNGYQRDRSDSTASMPGTTLLPYAAPIAPLGSPNGYQRDRSASMPGTTLPPYAAPMTPPGFPNGYQRDRSASTASMPGTTLLPYAAPMTPPGFPNGYQRDRSASAASMPGTTLLPYAAPVTPSGSPNGYQRDRSASAASMPATTLLPYAVPIVQHQPSFHSHTMSLDFRGSSLLPRNYMVSASSVSHGVSSSVADTGPSNPIRVHRRRYTEGVARINKGDIPNARAGVESPPPPRYEP